MLTAAGQAFREMFAPPFRAVLFKCVGFTIALLVLLIIAVEWSFNHFVQWPDWITGALPATPEAGVKSQSDWQASAAGKRLKRPLRN